MELCDKYLYELIEINPTINDFFILKEFIHKRHIQPNVYSERYYEKLHQLVPYLKVDMTSALGVLITYQDNDGD